MSEICELCRHAGLTKVHATEAGACFLLCGACGLVQRQPRENMAERPSCDADPESAIAALSRHADLGREMSVLSVGASHDQIVTAMNASAPAARITSIHPMKPSAVLDAEIVCLGIHDVALETERFNVVYSSRMIDRVAEPARLLADHWRVLKPGGLLVLEASNIAALALPEMTGEMLDATPYLFSARTLMRFVSAAGFAIVSPADPADCKKFLLVARKVGRAHGTSTIDPGEVMEAERLIKTFTSRRGKLQRAA